MFVEKLNKKQNGVYTIEEEKSLVDGKWEGNLEHDNVNHESVVIYTGSKLTGDKIENFFLSTPSQEPWKTHIKLFSDAPSVFVVYESAGDQVEAEDINNIQDEIVNEVKRSTLEDNRLDTKIQGEIIRAITKENTIETNKSDKTYVDVELSKKVDKVIGKSLSDENYTSSEKTKLLGIEANANKYIHPSTHEASMITESTAKRFVSDSEKTTWNNKPDKTHVDTELNKRYLKTQTFTKDEVLQKIQDVIGLAPAALDTLSEIANALNNDANFAGTMTNELSSKVDKIAGKSLSDENYTSLEKSKLLGIETDANKYIHPATHSSSVITDTSTKRFVTDVEKTAWNGKSDKTYVDTVFVKKEELGQAGYGDMSKIVYDTNNNGKVDVAEIIDLGVDKSINDLPSTYPIGFSVFRNYGAWSLGIAGFSNKSSKVETIKHTNSCVQRVTILDSGTSPRILGEYVRACYSGDTWGEWSKVLIQGTTITCNDLRGL